MDTYERLRSELRFSRLEASELRVLTPRGARFLLRVGPLAQAAHREALYAVRTGQPGGWYAVEVVACNRRPRALRERLGARVGCRRVYGHVPLTVVAAVLDDLGGIKEITCTTPR